MVPHNLQSKLLAPSADTHQAGHSQTNERERRWFRNAYQYEIVGNVRLTAARRIAVTINHRHPSPHRCGADRRNARNRKLLSTLR